VQDAQTAAQRCRQVNLVVAGEDEEQRTQVALDLEKRISPPPGAT
jgi:hypothetical protein